MGSESHSREGGGVGRKALAHSRPRLSSTAETPGVERAHRGPAVPGKAACRSIMVGTSRQKTSCLVDWWGWSCARRQRPPTTQPELCQDTRR